ncbi:MAG: hypothetical protein BJ554DRAFT_2677, partial [Olpidium bornovanus]
VAIRRGGKLQGPETDVVQGLVVDAEGLIGVFDELVNGQGRVVRLDDGIGHLKSRRTDLFYARDTRGSKLGAAPRGTNLEFAFREDNGRKNCYGNVPSVTGQRRTCTSCDRGTPRGFWKSGEFPYLRSKSQISPNQGRIHNSSQNRK